MSLPLQQQQPEPQGQQIYSTPSHGSIGTAIGIVVVVAVLGIIAGLLGRLCSGRRAIGNREYDLEAWVERKCSSCIDGRINPPPPPPPPPIVNEPVTVEIPINVEASKPLDPPAPQNPPAASAS